jgi:hypothetical protein
MTTSDRSDLLPWGWSITPKDSDIECPTASSILQTLALVNVVVSTLSILFGNRRVLHYLTHKWWFKWYEDPLSRSYRWTWIINVALQLGANALIAFIFKRTPGYLASFQIWELMLFFTVRPRLSWIALGVLGMKSWGEIKKRLPRPQPAFDGNQTSYYYGRHEPYFEGAQSQPRERNGYQSFDVSDSEHSYDGNRPKPLGIPSGKDYPWRSSAIAQIYCEIVLQGIALYIMGRTAHFAASLGYYKIGTTTYKELPKSAHIMYAGALYYLITGGMMLVFEVICILGSFCFKGRLSDDAYSAWIALYVVVNLFTTWLGSWIFWVGFVRLAGPQYCPPKLYAQGTVWGVFSFLGILIGGGGS